MVDSHAHLGLCEPRSDQLVTAAREAGVRRVLTVGLDEDSNRGAVADAEAADAVFACVGRHPNSATGFDDGAATTIEELAEHPRVVAIGETGFDFYREGASREDQRRAFSAQVEIARRTGLALVVHIRDGAAPEADAVAASFELLVREAEGVDVVLHCFSAEPSRVADAAQRGWYCSFAGNVTYPRADRLREAARLVPAELLLVETDSPFLAPQPVRGKPNQPAHVVATANRLAELRGVELDGLERTIDANAARTFGW